MVRSPKTTARFGSLAVEIATATPDDVPAPVAFSVPVQLSGDDLWAALWYSARLGADEEELADLECVREMVADGIVNGGLENAVNEAAAQIYRLTPGSPEHAFALELREIALRAFAPVLPAPTPAPRRELEGVSA